MEKHDREQRQIFQHVPNNRGVSALTGLDLDRCDNKPRPVEEDIDSGDTEQMDRTLASIQHIVRLRHEPRPFDRCTHAITLPSALAVAYGEPQGTWAWVPAMHRLEVHTASWNQGHPPRVRRRHVASMQQPLPA